MIWTMKTKLIAFVAGLALFLVFSLLYSPSSPGGGPSVFTDGEKIYSLTSKVKECTRVARSYASKHDLLPLQSCNIEEYTADGESIYSVGFTYGVGEDCPSGCIYKGHYALIKSDGEEVAGALGWYFDMADVLPVDKYGYACADAMDTYAGSSSGADRKLLYDGNEYRWRLIFDRVSGIYDKNFVCELSGEFTQHMGGEVDVRNLAVSYPEVGDCGKYKLRTGDGPAESQSLVSCCQQFNTIKVNMPQAASTVNDSYCSSLSLLQACELEYYQEREDYCLEHIRLDDPVACGQAKERRVRNYCYEATAITLGQPELCYNIPPPQFSGELDVYRTACFMDVASGLNDPSVCHNIDRPAMVDVCVSDVAAQNESQ